MKTFETLNFLVRGFEEDSSICYLVDTLADDTRMGYFEVCESKENANVLAVYLNTIAFKEVFTAYQRQLKMPVFFWDADPSITQDTRRMLKDIKAVFKEDTEHETRWFSKPNSKVFKLGNREKT